MNFRFLYCSLTPAPLEFRLNTLLMMKYLFLIKRTIPLDFLIRPIEARIDPRVFENLFEFYSLRI